MIRIQSILCPVDFFPASMRAADFAIDLARKYNAKLHLLHIVSPILYSAEQYALTVSEIIDSLERQATRELKKLEGKAIAAGLKVSTDSRTGEVRHEIESAIRTTKADILVMGTHGRQGFEKLFLGSVTERMLHKSTVPVITLRGTKKSSTPLRRILVTTDFSEDTALALNYALSIGQATDTPITLMHILEEARALTSAEYREVLKKRVQRELLELIPADTKNLPDIETTIEAGTPHHMILRVLKKRKIDLLVMNTHGKGMLDRVLLGSTSERVLRAAKCPVMLIPPAKGAKLRRRAKKRDAERSSPLLLHLAKPSPAKT